MLENTNQKELVENIKSEWKRLWSERVDDHVRAEAISNENYSLLSVDRGTVIHATRDFKALSLKDALDQNKIENSSRHIPVDNQVGGWHKFAKIYFNKSAGSRVSFASDSRLSNNKVCSRQQLKKGGRGWLHV